ncbi:RloB domain-containing protein [bacterium]|nr:RloB domain-containing protein [bacterium]
MTAKSRNRRAIRPVRKAIDAVAVIIDGETEEWYIKQVKVKYNPSVTRTLKITPEFPEKKSVKELFNLAKGLIETETYTRVFLIVDLDEVLKSHSEWQAFQNLYNKSQNPSKSYQWMKKLEVIVNTPCLEYWYLLHFKKTTRFYEDYARLKPELRKIPELAGYEKTEEYYNNTPQIYNRLFPYLTIARSNAFKFDVDNAAQQGCSEMYKIFDYIDERAEQRFPLV